MGRLLDYGHSDCSGPLFLQHQIPGFHMFMNDSYLEFGRDDSFRTTWAFAAEAAAKVWHGTHPAVVEAKSRRTFHSVSVW